jgi:hypothetical protein
MVSGKNCCMMHGKMLQGIEPIQGNNKFAFMEEEKRAGKT